MEKIIKDNRWNRIFHKKQVAKQTKLYDRYRNMLMSSEELLMKVAKATCLTQLVSIHKEAWKIGYRNNNLAPCKYGIFRTKDILSMTVDEVFLGGIYGLNTHNIRFWEDCIDSPIGPNRFGIDNSIKIYSLIMEQYRKLLSSNIRVMRDEIRDYIVKYNLINPPEDSTKVW